MFKHGIYYKKKSRILTYQSSLKKYGSDIFAFEPFVKYPYPVLVLTIGSRLRMGIWEEKPLEWLVVSVSRRAVTLIATNPIDRDDIDVDGEYYCCVDDNEINECLTHMEEKILKNCFSSLEKEWLIDLLPWRKRPLVHFLSETEADRYLFVDGCENETLLRMKNEYKQIVDEDLLDSKFFLITHLDVQMEGMLPDFGSYCGHKLNWIFLEHSFRGIECISERALKHKSHFSGISEWLNTEENQWLNHEFVDSVFSEEEKQRLIPYEKKQEFNFNNLEEPFRNDPFEKSVKNPLWLLTAEEVFTYFPTVDARIARDVDGFLTSWCFMDQVDASYVCNGVVGLNAVGESGNIGAMDSDQGWGCYMSVSHNLRPTIMIRDDM